MVISHLKGLNFTHQCEVEQQAAGQLLIVINHLGHNWWN